MCIRHNNKIRISGVRVYYTINCKQHEKEKPLPKEAVNFNSIRVVCQTFQSIERFLHTSSTGRYKPIASSEATFLFYTTQEIQKSRGIFINWYPSSDWLWGEKIN